MSISWVQQAITEAVETECQLSSEAALGIAPELYHELKSTLKDGGFEATTYEFIVFSTLLQC